MKPFCEIGPVSIYQGDVREVLPQLEAESVHCVVTSPPYWGLRDYGTASWKGGSADCGHEKPTTNYNEGFNARWGNGDGTAYQKQENKSAGQYSHSCPKCGAVRIDSQLGLERTPDEYISNMVGVFREVKRVLRADGTLWLNMGDCYATGAGKVGERPGGGDRGDKWAGTAGPGHRGQHLPNQSGKQAPRIAAMGPMTQPNRMPLEGLKAKDLVGMPWRLAFALQAQGWWLRNDIIWAKPNPMPESCTDRCTKSHEYLFLLAKSETYHCDMAAIKEESITGDLRKPYAPGQVDARGNGHDRGGGQPRRPKAWDEDMGSNRTLVARQPRKIKIPGGWDRGSGGHGTIHRNGRTYAEYQRVDVDILSRNRRTVWTVATQPFPDAHFATFPEDLIKPCILAGCPAGGTVLDPFFGSGTTGLVARANGCKCIGIELNPEYIEIAARRLNQHVLAFGETSPEQTDGGQGPVQDMLMRGDT